MFSKQHINALNSLHHTVHSVTPGVMDPLKFGLIGGEGVEKIC